MGDMLIRTGAAMVMMVTMVRMHFAGRPDGPTEEAIARRLRRGRPTSW